MIMANASTLQMDAPLAEQLLDQLPQRGKESDLGNYCCPIPIAGDESIWAGTEPPLQATL